MVKQKSKLLIVSLVALVGGHGVLEQGDNGEGSYTAGDGCHPTAFGIYLVVLHVTDDTVAALLRGVGNTMDAHVDHHSTILHHVGSDEFGLADSHHQDVGLEAELLEVLGLAVT